MANLIPHINSTLSPETQRMLYLISSFGREAAEEVYCFGSFVRDLFMGREKRKIDLIISPLAVDFARRLTTTIPGRLIINDELQTVSLILPDGFTFNMVTAMNQFNPFSEPDKLDLLKRALFAEDFTIDTLAFSLNMEDFGEVYDFFEGVSDLEAAKLRVLYKMSFADNPLRIIRLIRLEQRLGFAIEEETNLLLTQAKKKHLLKKVSKESLSYEIRLIFREFSPARILVRLEELKLFNQLFPRITVTFELFRKLGVLEENLRQKENQGGQSPFISYLAVLCSDLSDNDISYLCRQIRLKTKERQQLQKIMQNAECRMQN